MLNVFKCFEITIVAIALVFMTIFLSNGIAQATAPMYASDKGVREGFAYFSEQQEKFGVVMESIDARLKALEDKQK